MNLSLEQDLSIWGTYRAAHERCGYRGLRWLSSDPHGHLTGSYIHRTNTKSWWGLPWNNLSIINFGMIVHTQGLTSVL